MFDGLPAQSRHFRPAIQPSLHSFDDVLVLPACDSSVLTGGALGLERTPRTGRGPVFMDSQPVLDRGEAPDRPLSCRTTVLVGRPDVAKVTLIKESAGLVVGGPRLGYQGVDSRAITFEDFRSAEVTAVGHDGYLRLTERGTRQFSHGQQLSAIMAQVDHIVRDD